MSLPQEITHEQHVRNLVLLIMGIANKPEKIDKAIYYIKKHRLATPFRLAGLSATRPVNSDWVLVPPQATREMIDAWRLDQAQGRSLESSYAAMIKTLKGLNYD